MSVTINKLEIENIKRVKAVKMEPSASGLTVVGGKNNQGKTSVLDAITWALGGDRYRPSDPKRTESVVPPYLHVELSNGIVVERKGKNSDLKVIDKTGNKAGQQLLNEFVSQLALNLPKFMQANNKEKADVLLQIIGVGQKLYELEQQEITLYNQRTTIGQIADQKKKYADEMTVYPDAPKELISASDLINQQQEILAKNGENQRKRAYAENFASKIDSLSREIQELENTLANKKNELIILSEDYETARKSAEQLTDESTEELEKNIADIEQINIKVRSNMDREKAEMDAQEYADKYRGLEWDDTIDRDSPEFVTIPGGDYDFEVTEFERGRHNGSEKLPPCNKAIVHIKITTPQGVTVIKHNLFLHTKTEGMLCEFFASIGQRKKGEKLKMNWNMVPGSHGRAKIGIRTYNENEYNEIKKFYPAEDVPSTTNAAVPASAQVSFEQGKF